MADGIGSFFYDRQSLGGTKAAMGRGGRHG
jgi:hypothetical protein